MGTTVASSVQVRLTEALARKTARKLTISNCLVMAVVLFAVLLILNVLFYVFGLAPIDSRSDYQTQVFIDEHQSSDDHAYGLSTSFIPVLYIKTADGELLNLHPTDEIPQNDIDTLLARDMPFGDSTAEIDGRFYRVHHTLCDVPITEGDQTYHVEEILLFRDITKEIVPRHRLIVASIVTYLLSLVAMIPAGYFMAKRAVAPIRDAWERQRQFSADASHKLKTPLAVMLANIELVLRHPEHRVADETLALQTSLDHAYKMRNTLSDLLTLTQVEESVVDHMYSVVDMGDVVEQMHEDFEQLAIQQKVELKVSTEKGALVLGDRDRLEELATVFIENAIHYTQPGGTISIECAPEGKYAVLVVADTGIGMDSETIAHAFDRFYRSERAQQVNPQGTGLGLPIAQWIAGRHGGRIDIESRKDEGTTVRVWLPLKND
ncbi:sensor histidine kinase [Raoultibacter massiliensis]|uniref:sensor histidine kinase n=1 Tax=Raoultibacter massiliensis TaxID=1852371 RepID=UPI003A91417C